MVGRFLRFSADSWTPVCGAGSLLHFSFVRAKSFRPEPGGLAGLL